MVQTSCWEVSALRTIRIRFTKHSEGAYVSLLDLQRIMGRAMRQANVPAWYSQGFNPHIYMTFAAPLALGHFSLCEAMDFKTESDAENFDEYIDKMTKALPKGIDVTEIYEALTGHDAIAYAEYEISFSSEYLNAFETSCKKYNSIENAEVEKKSKRGTKLINLKEYLPNIETNNNAAKILLPAGNVMNINPELILNFLQGLGGAPTQYGKILRKRLVTNSLEDFL